MTDKPILSRRFDANELPAHGLDIEIVATEAQRVALAEAYEVPTVESLTATATLMPAGKGVSVSGRVVADIVQSCVVTLEPVPQHIDETFAVRFVPESSREARKAREVVVDAAEDFDPPEQLDGTSFDLGALAEEAFVLAIDPYPRAPGAELEVPADEDDDPAADSPFAVLRGRREGGS